MLGSLRKHALGEVPAVRKARIYSESDAQRAVVAWIRAREGWMVMRIENAARRTGAQANRDRGLGMQVGAPDLWVWFRSFAFFIEMKSENGRLSDEQQKLHAQLSARGCHVLVGWGSEKTIQALTEIEFMGDGYFTDEDIE
jgi:hypothetical protein